MKHARQTSDGIGATREAKQTDLVTLLVILHQEPICILDMYTETTADGHIHGCADTIAKTTSVVGANTGLVVYLLLASCMLLQTGHKMDDIAVVGIELVPVGFVSNS